MEMNIKLLSTEEKVNLVKGVSFFRMAKIPSQGFEGLFCLDGGTGLNFEQMFGDFCCVDEEKKKYFGSRTLQNVIAYYYAPEKLNEEEAELHAWITEELKKKCNIEFFSPGCFPTGLLMGATWNPEVVYRMAAALGKEAAAYGVDLLLGTPFVNMARDPLAGRLFEGYGEDPYHMTVLAPEMVRGVQEQGVAANVKHFAANNQESFRVGLNETISKRALYEIYLPAFRACVEAGVATVMSAYNQINGVPCTESKWLLQELLRGDWGFDGTVISDWGAVAHLDKAVAAGNDLAMPGPIDGTPLYEALEKGLLTEEELTAAAERVLQLIKTCKDLKEKAALANADAGMEGKELTAGELMKMSDEAAYRAAVEGIVLLKNEKDIFPLKGDVALFGEGAKAFFDCGTGSAGITTDRTGSLIKELQKRKGEDHVTFEEVTDRTEVLLVVVRKQGMEGNDHTDMFLPKEEREKLKEVLSLAKKLGKKAGVILNVCGPVDCSDFADIADGIFLVYLPGMQGARAAAALICGEENPSGRLTVTFPRRYEDTPTYLNFPGDGYHTVYGENIFVGYRYYDTKKMPVQYPFGHGLSYTIFTYGPVHTDKEKFSDEITVTVEVTNSGSVKGKEVVMLFVKDEAGCIRKPEKELKGFQKIELNPGESRDVCFRITKDMLASFDMDLDRWEAEEGYYQMIIARSATDIVGKKRVYGAWKSAYSYSVDTPMKVLYQNGQTHEIIVDLFKDYGLDIGCPEDIYEYTSHMPLRTAIDRAVNKLADAMPGLQEQIIEKANAALAGVEKT